MVRAAEAGDSERVKKLLRDGVSPDAHALRPEGEIFGGVLKIHQGEMKFERGGVINGWRSPRITALQAAAGGGHRETVEILIKAGAHVNTRGSDFLGRTALQAAAEIGHEEIVRSLLAAGANVNTAASEREGRTALQAAAGGRHGEKGEEEQHYKQQ
jgi:hypothetical protein